MPYQLLFEPDLNVVSIEAWDGMDYPDYTEMTKSAIDLARQNDAKLFFCDVRNMEDRSKLSDILRIHRLYSFLGQTKDTRLAVLVDKKQKDYNTLVLFELSCTARGWSVRSFLQKETAIQWLCA